MIPIEKNKILALIHYEKVKVDLVGRIEKILQKGKIKKKNNIRNLSQLLRRYLGRLIASDYEELKNLIICEPESLSHCINFFNGSGITYDDHDSDDYFILQCIFENYGYDRLDKCDFIDRITLDTCPYCNRNYIYTVGKNKELKPQIDHFYPKAQYPFLAVSYYNLIPSCPTCNGFGAKEDLDPIVEGLTNPYLINNESFKFSYKVLSADYTNPLASANIVDITFLKKIDGHLKVFKLDELYQKHTDHVSELILKSRISYSRKYRAYLEGYSGLNFSNSELNRLILGNYSTEDTIHKRSLAKLYRDIGIELGLI